MRRLIDDLLSLTRIEQNEHVPPLDEVDIVEVVRDAAFSTIAAAVEITTADGTTHRLSQTAARGSDVNPMSDGDLEQKLRTAAGGWDSRHDITPLIDAVWALDKSEDVSRLAALAVPR